MPTEAAPKPNRETWRDWLPTSGRDVALQEAEPVMTRDELVVELRDLGHDVSARDLIYWQTRGAIPYPTRQKRRGTSVAVYPRWMVNVIHTLRTMQEQGYTLREIGPFMRDHLYHLFSPRPKTPEQEAREARRREWRALFPLFDEIDPRIRALARTHEAIHGEHIARAEIRLVLEDGSARTYLVAIGSGDEANSGVDGVKDDSVNCV